MCAVCVRVCVCVCLCVICACVCVRVCACVACARDRRKTLTSSPSTMCVTCLLSMSSRYVARCTQEGAPKMTELAAMLSIRSMAVAMAAVPVVVCVWEDVRVYM